MKTDSISLGADLAKLLGDCTVGDTKDITLRVTVDGMDEGGFRGTVQNVVEYEDPTDEEEPPAPKPKAPKPPMKPGAAKKAPALAEAMGEDY